MSDFNWFIGEVELLASRLNLPLPYGAEEKDSFKNTRGRWECEEKITLATENNVLGHSETNTEENQDGTNSDPELRSSTEQPTSMAFNISLTPADRSPKKVGKAPVLRIKKNPMLPRPHTVHLETRDPSQFNPIRPRTYSNSNEQDENKPPPESVAFEIADSKDEKLNKNRDRMLRRQIEREEQQKRKRLNFEELKRNQEKEKLMNEQYVNNLKRLDQERREAILQNHKQAKSPQASRTASKKMGITIPIDPFSPSKVTRSQSTTLHRSEPKDTEWDTVSCVSTYTTIPLFKQPSTKSNKPLMLMALKYQCLPGPVNAVERKRAEDMLNSSSACHFIALYKQNKYKGLYEVEQLEDVLKICKIHGTGPKEVHENMIADLLKYNSGLKAFQSVGSKTLSPSIDGFCIKNAFWLTKRPKTTTSHVRP